MKLRSTKGLSGLTPFEALYGRPFLTRDLPHDPQTIQLVFLYHTSSHVPTYPFRLQPGSLWRETNHSALFCPGDLVLIKSLKDVSPSWNVLICCSPYLKGLQNSWNGFMDWLHQSQEVVLHTAPIRDKSEKHLRNGWSPHLRANKDLQTIQITDTWVINGQNTPISIPFLLLSLLHGVSVSGTISIAP